MKGFDWSSLPADGIVVDVGGGIGSTSMLLAESYDHLKFVVQDREVVVAMGEKVTFHFGFLFFYSSWSFDRHGKCGALNFLNLARRHSKVCRCLFAPELHSF
jgi:hypothetical protein